MVIEERYFVVNERASRVGRPGGYTCCMVERCSDVQALQQTRPVRKLFSHVPLRVCIRHEVSAECGLTYNGLRSHHSGTAG